VAKRSLLAMHDDAQYDHRSAIIDMVTDMMHLSRHLGYDFDEDLLPLAVHNFEEEQQPRSEPGHYHLEFKRLEGSESDDEENICFNGTIDDCAVERRINDGKLVKACFICQFGCGVDHELNDNERVTLGITPKSFLVEYPVDHGPLPGLAVVIPRNPTDPE
jgi:hypothetical protein